MSRCLSFRTGIKSGLGLLGLVALSMQSFGQAPRDKDSQLCIAVAFPTVEGVSGNAAETANGLRELMNSYLQGPSIKVVALDAKLPSQAAEEAKAKGCEPMLSLAFSRKSGGNRGFMQALGRGASASSWRLPGGGSTASSIAHTGAAAGLEAAGSLAQSTRAKDEVRLEYKLQTADGHVQFGPRTEHQTAKSDGEDLMTPMVMRAAEAVVGEVKKSKDK